MGNKKNITMKPSESNFKNLISFINKNKQLSINTIVEIGARDCNETLLFNNAFPNAQIFSFECNPATLPVCKKNISGIKNIKLIEKAVSNKNETIKFYPIDQEKTQTSWVDGNPGASSAFKASDKYNVEKYIQTEITVEATTIENLYTQEQLSSIDVLWMDIQGSELNALKGAVDKISDIKLIHTEVEFAEIYQNQPLFWDIKKYLVDNGFLLVKFTSFSTTSGDAVFINKRYTKSLLHTMKYTINNKLLYPFLYYKKKLFT